MTPRAIPFADVRSLLPLARRTTLVRTAAAVVLVALALAAVLLGRHPEVRESTVLPKRSNGIVVLDLSASISPDTYARIGATLRELTESGGRYGLVVFSDTAYEAIPPGTPSEALRPLAALLHAATCEHGGLPADVPREPVGELVQRGHEDLDRARARARRDHRRGARREAGRAAR